MNRNYSILALAAALSLGACASDNMAMRDTNGNPDAANTPDSSKYSDGTMRSDMNTSTASLPDNPQVPGSEKTSNPISDQDRLFISRAMAGGQYEVSAADKALLHSNDVQVKDLAQHMLDDHMKANDQLKNLASRKGFRTIVSPTADQIDMLARLDKLNGPDFDSEYLNQQRQAHEETISVFDAAAKISDDKDIKDWAAATLPTLRGHLDMINNLRKNASIGMAQ